MARFAALVIMMNDLLKFLNLLSELQTKTTGLGEKNVFAALLVNSVGIEWGWLPLIGGALAVLGGGSALWNDRKQ